MFDSQLQSKLDSSSEETSALRAKLRAVESSVQKLSDDREAVEKSRQQSENEASAAAAEREKYKTVLTSTVHDTFLVVELGTMIEYSNSFCSVV